MGKVQRGLGIVSVLLVLVVLGSVYFSFVFAKWFIAAAALAVVLLVWAILAAYQRSHPD